MVYEDSEDRLMDLDETEAYEQDESGNELIDTFREQIPGDTADEIDADEVIEGEAASESPISSAKVEDGFGESINPDSSPHLNEPLEDQDLSDEDVTEDFFIDE